MSNTLQLSPMLQAIELLRVNIDALQLDDLVDHATLVLDTIGALNSYISYPVHKSADELRNAVRQSQKLLTHMAHVRDLIDAHNESPRKP